MGIFLSRERRSAGMTFPEPIIPPYPGADVFGGGGPVGPVAALTVPTVWACVALVSNAVSMLPLEVFRLAPDGVPRKQTPPPLLMNPSGDMTQSEWLHMLMMSLLLRGNAYGKISGRDTYLRPTQIDLLNPDLMKIEVDRDTGRLTYKYGPTNTDITADIWHVRNMTMPGTRVGLSPIDLMASTLRIDISSRQFATDFFSGGGIPKAVVTTDQAVNQEQSRTIKDRLLAATRNREPIVLGQGLTYAAISVKPEESQFLLTQQQNVAQIARYFGVPPEMVGGSGGNSLTYANVEQRQLDFLTLGVQFWLKRIEDAVFGLLPTPVYAQFNTAVLLRTDAETQAKVDNQHLAGKTRTPTELRQRDGLPPLTEDQKKEVDLVPLVVTPLGSVKATPALKELPGPAAPVPANDSQVVQANSLPGTVHFYQGNTEIVVQPAPAAEVRQQINVAPSPAPVVQVPVTVQPSPPAEVRMVTVGSDVPQARSRRVERDSSGDIIRIVEE